ncbi:glycosyltransferase family 2 protein [Marinimicrobium sp. LS-A18]|uniref:glycosyltransferase family 2 protein n=1 Tax=Marinimicrobium sp. LS-A18 TaxID=1381596 RepID=UPI0004AE7CCD|nr:glycosyltransferase family 2 protein [Marinimicrobium sp. LS-A18]
MTMPTFFWASVVLILYIYIGYPLLMRLLPRNPVRIRESAELPSVTVLIPAYNEADVIEQTVRNKLEQAYPSDRLEVIVISDESSDGTDEIVRTIANQDSRVKLLRQEPRQGKTAGLNRAVEEAAGEIIIFSDANSQFASDALKHLVAPFSDDSVGYVTGKMVYVNEEGNLIGDGCGAYMRYENSLRHWESRVSSVVGVDGGVDAVRKSLYQPMSPDQLPDFVQPLKVVEQGKRVVYTDSALLHEESLKDSQSEFKMRVRVSLRAYWAMWDMRHLMNPLRYGVFSLQLISHKLLRYLAFVPLLAALVSGLILADVHWIYALASIVQIVFYSVAGYSIVEGGSGNRLVNLINYFSLINTASMIAFVKFVKGEKIVIWKPRGG